MHNFKPGDLAYIVRSINPGKVGRIVTVLSLINDTQKQYVAFGVEHEGAADGSPSAFVDFGGEKGVWLYALADLERVEELPREFHA